MDCTDNQCARFRALTEGLGPRSSTKGSCSCFNKNVGDEYICPQVGSTRGPGAQCADCHHQSPSNLGIHHICGPSLTRPESAQTGGGDGGPAADYSMYYRPIYNSCDSVVRHPKRRVDHGPIDYSLTSGDEPVRTSYLPSAQPGRDFSTVERVGAPVSSTDPTALCGGHERCGNGRCPKPAKRGPCCKKADPPLRQREQETHPWVYGVDDIPSYSLDLSGPLIGGRPQWSRGTNNSVPPMMLQNTVNLPGREFACRQPCWGSKCI